MKLNLMKGPEKSDSHYGMSFGEANDPIDGITYVIEELTKVISLVRLLKHFSIIMHNDLR